MNGSIFLSFGYSNILETCKRKEKCLNECSRDGDIHHRGDFLRLVFTTPDDYCVEFAYVKSRDIND